VERDYVLEGGVAEYCTNPVVPDGLMCTDGALQTTALDKTVTITGRCVVVHVLPFTLQYCVRFAAPVQTARTAIISDTS
jgi:hypothetical protein